MLNVNKDSLGTRLVRVRHLGNLIADLSKVNLNTATGNEVLAVQAEIEQTAWRVLEALNAKIPDCGEIQSYPNARLIAQAPAMLRILAHVLTLCDHGGQDECAICDDGTDVDIRAIINAIEHGA